MDNTDYRAAIAGAVRTSAVGASPTSIVADDASANNGEKAKARFQMESYMQGESIG